MIAENYNSYWDSSYDLNEPVDTNELFYWTGIGTGAVLASSSESCNGWTSAVNSVSAHLGHADKKIGEDLGVMLVVFAVVA